ncbi:cytochrome P450 [Microbacterium lacus]|uniref:cytochrome P450 n=1 Tax=Microbacterium lacus TaxID=415217 RepID=UPI0031DD040B
MTRHELATEILRDPRFTREFTRLPMSGEPHANIDADATESIRVGGPLDNDGSVHARLRRAITGRLSVKAARSYRPRIEEIVQEQLASLQQAEARPIDLTAAYSEPISARVHCLVMGVPADREDEYFDVFVGASTLQDKFDFARARLAEKRGAPSVDVLSDLASSDLSRHEKEGLALVMLSAGRDSVAHLISTSTVALLREDRSQWEWLRTNPEGMVRAVEEFVRVGSLFLTLFSRTAKEDVVYDSLTVRAGESVSVALPAANRDPRRFDRPDTFDVQRDAYGHLGFGYGIHGCAGQQVARVAITEAISALLRGLPTLELVDADQLRPMPFAHPVATYKTGAVRVEW